MRLRHCVHRASESGVETKDMTAAGVIATAPTTASVFASLIVANDQITLVTAAKGARCRVRRGSQLRCYHN